MPPAIVVENLSKRYRISHEAGGRPTYKTLREELVRVAQVPWNWLTRQSQPNVEDFWALKDVSFEVQPGEVVGVIGRNGAGKSTLLKILSRITPPTSGRVRMRGRVGSLLEVGTGFHPELTGRENIFLSGAILGMPRREIFRKFDEIVAFADISQFLDTPVKRYSSGMYMRLAFAVAAHLETEILLIDEVLAVGDAEFQKKCLGKLDEVAKDGRTVIFVSHTLHNIGELTSRCIFLRTGEVAFFGGTRATIAAYQQTFDTSDGRSSRYTASTRVGGNYIESCEVETSEQNSVHHWGRPLAFQFDIRIERPTPGMCFSFQVIDEVGRPCCHFWMFEDGAYRRSAGLYRYDCVIPKLRLYMGNYSLVTWLSDQQACVMYEHLSSICPFEISMLHISRPGYPWAPGDMTYLEDAEWRVGRVE